MKELKKGYVIEPPVLSNGLWALYLGDEEKAREFAYTLSKKYGYIVHELNNVEVYDDDYNGGYGILLFEENDGPLCGAIYSPLCEEEENENEMLVHVIKF